MIPGLIAADPLANHSDPVNHPKHYNSHPSGVECIEVIRHMTFNVGNAVKYCWRAGLKVIVGQTTDMQGISTADRIQDLKKAIWYLQDEVALLEKSPENKHESTQPDSCMRPDSCFYRLATDSCFRVNCRMHRPK